MATRHRHETESPQSLQEGDFRRISGIGPGIEHRLKAAGIETFDQLAVLSIEELLDALSGMVGITAERIVQQDWTGQARALALQVQREEQPLTPEAEENGARQHYESFMLELLLDASGEVRRTRVVHVQNGIKDTWAGWDTARLLRWVEQQANLPKEEIHLPTPASPAPPRALTGQVAIQGLELLSLPDYRSERFLSAWQPLAVHLHIDVSRVTTRFNSQPVHYRAVAQAHRLGSDTRIPLGEQQGTLDLSDPAQPALITLSGRGAPEGTYRLEAAVHLSLEKDKDDSLPPSPRQEDLWAILEGELFQVLATTPTPSQAE